MMTAQGFSGGVWRGLLFLMLAADASAQLTTNLVNDGSTTNNLVVLQNTQGTAGAQVLLQLASTGPGLEAIQTPDYSDFPVNSVFYNRNVSTPGPDYAVIVDAQPGAAFAEHRVGAMGWLDPQLGRGIAFRVRPGGTFGAASFQLSVLDLHADNENDNDSVGGLFNLDGTAATAEEGSAWATGGDPGGEVPGYRDDLPATFILQFNAPTAADRAVLATATAHVTARVYQVLEEAAEAVQVGGTIELLTTLAAPVAHRFGYHAVWASNFVPGGLIGTFTRLSLVGRLDVVHQPPTIALTSPTEGAQFAVPATVTLTATAQAQNAQIATVEFFLGDTAVGTATTAPYTVTASVVAAGSYTFTAKATDSTGASTTSAPVTITTVASASPARLTLPQAFPSAVNFQQFKFVLEGSPGGTYVTETTTDYLTWIPVATNTLSGATADVLIPRGATQNVAAFRALSAGGGTTPGDDATLGGMQLLPSTTDFQHFRFTVIGLNGKSYRVESTTDWVNWKVERSGIGAAEVEEMIFQRQGAFIFYRAVVLP
ncbi:MAG: Ig-like domain-containing protein [Limisphaerales bacterium]